MKITVEYKTQVKSAAGISSEEFEFEDDCTVKQLIHLVGKKHGDPLKKMLLDSDDNLQKSILLFLEDRHLKWDEVAKLHDGDVLTVFSPISGG